MIGDGIRLIPSAMHLTLVPGRHARARRAGDQRLRRRRPRRARPARQGAHRALTWRASSSAGCSRWSLVLFAISVLTFLIFQAIPNGDPALRLAGRTVDAGARSRRSARTWGFDKPIYVQYGIDDGEDLHRHGRLLHAADQRRRRDQARPAGDAVAGDRRGGHLARLRHPLRGAQRGEGRASSLDRALTVLSLVGVSTPVFLLGALVLYLPRYKLTIFPPGGYVALTKNPWGWFTHLILPWFALSVLFIGFYSRVLRSNILDTINEDYVRTARAKGISERARADPPRAAQLADPDHLAVRPRLRGGDRRRRDPHRVGLQPPRRRPVRGRVDPAASTSRPSWSSRCSARSSWSCSARSSTSSTPCSTRRIRLSA